MKRTFNNGKGEEIRFFLIKTV